VGPTTSPSRRPDFKTGAGDGTARSWYLPERFEPDPKGSDAGNLLCCNWAACGVPPVRSGELLLPVQSPAHRLRSACCSATEGRHPKRCRWPAGQWHSALPHRLCASYLVFFDGRSPSATGSPTRVARHNGPHIDEQLGRAIRARLTASTRANRCKWPLISTLTSGRLVRRHPE